MLLMSCFYRTPQTDAVVDAAMVAAGGSNDALANMLDVHKSQIARMKAGNDAGPGLARFGRCSAGWWIAFIKHMAPIFGLIVIDNEQMAEYIRRTDQVQVRMLKMELAMRGTAAETECA